MYQRLLAPFDGSDISECTLPHIRAIAIGCNVPEVIILRVVEPLSAQAMSALAQLPGDQIARLEQENQAEAENYVNILAQKLGAEGVNARPLVLNGNAAEQILNYSRDHQVELVIMSTHGRSGITRWFFGSVADRVVTHSLVPVLVVTPSGCRHVV